MLNERMVQITLAKHRCTTLIKEYTCSRSIEVLAMQRVYNYITKVKDMLHHGLPKTSLQVEILAIGLVLGRAITVDLLASTIA